jgi:hypothetical protein
MQQMEVLFQASAPLLTFNLQPSTFPQAAQSQQVFMLEIPIYHQ